MSCAARSGARVRETLAALPCLINIISLKTGAAIICLRFYKTARIMHPRERELGKKSSNSVSERVKKIGRSFPRIATGCGSNSYEDQRRGPPTDGLIRCVNHRTALARHGLCPADGRVW